MERVPGGGTERYAHLPDCEARPLRPLVPVAEPGEANGVPRLLKSLTVDRCPPILKGCRSRMCADREPQQRTSAAFCGAFKE